MHQWIFGEINLYYDISIKSGFFEPSLISRIHGDDLRVYEDDGIWLYNFTEGK